MIYAVSFWFCKKEEEEATYRLHVVIGVLAPQSTAYHPDLPEQSNRIQAILFPGNYYISYRPICHQYGVSA